MFICCISYKRVPVPKLITVENKQEEMSELTTNVLRVIVGIIYDVIVYSYCCQRKHRKGRKFDLVNKHP